MNLLTVKEVATLLEISEHTIRFYSDKGLIPMLKRNKNNVRIFDDDSLNCLLTIKHLRNTGMSLEDIKEYIDLCLIGDTTTKQRYQIIAKQLSITKQQLIETKQRISFLEEKVKNYQNILHSDIPDHMNIIK